jgi:hypothetical protein
LGHVSDPRGLLALTEALYGRCPEAWLVAVPARSLGLGEPLSPAAAAGLRQAVDATRALIDGTITGQDTEAGSASGRGATEAGS